MIFNMEKIFYLLFSGLQMYLHLVKVLEDNYPEMMKRLYVINGTSIRDSAYRHFNSLRSED